MQHQLFSAGIKLEPEAAYIQLFGEINQAAESGLLAACESAVAASATLIALDFSEVTYINSTGIALIVQLLAKARKSGRRVIGYGLSQHYMEIFKITRLSDFIDLYSDQASAFESAN